MTIGPFRIDEFESIKNELEAKKVVFDFYIDKDLEEEIMANYHQNAAQAPRAMAGRLDIRIVFVEMTDTEYEKAKIVFEKHGILAQSDGSFELGE